jgi:hypothetical protein
MADRYWVGGTANWDGTAGTKWATTSGGAGGASVPTSADDVFLDAASGVSTVSVSNVNANVKSLNCTGFTGTLAGDGGVIIAAGNLTLGAGMGFTNTGAWQFNGTGTITSNGVVFTAVMSLNGTGATVTLGGAFTSTSNFVVARGTFTTSANNYSFTAARLTSSGSLTRQIDLNGSTVTLSGLAGWEAGAATGFTFNAGTSSIVLTAAGANITSNGNTFNNVSLTSTSAGASVVSGDGTFATLSITSPSSGVSKLVRLSGNQTITTLVAAGSSVNSRIMFASDITVEPRTMTVGTYTTKSDVDFRAITAAGASSPWSGTRIGDGGGNTNITGAAPKTVYWNLSGSQQWSATAWATSSGGSPNAANFPLPQDSVVFDEAGAAGTVTVNSQNAVNTVDFSARTTAMTLSIASSNVLFVQGNLITGSGVTYSGTSRLTFTGQGTQNFTSAGKTITQQFIINCAGSVVLQDALTVSVVTVGSIALESGTFDLGGYNVTITSGSFNGDGAAARTLAFGASVFTVGGNFDTSESTNLTVTGSGTIRMTRDSQKTFSSGSADYSGITIDQAGAGLLVFGNAGTVGNISNSYASTGATSIRFDQNQTVGEFTASGQSGRVLTITSSTNGLARTLTKTSGVVAVDFLNIRDSTATGGADWYAGANSVNTSNNTGWIFTAAPSVGGGSFIAFFM